MNTASRAIGVVVGCLVLLGSCSAFGDDWPQWRGSNRDAKVTDFTAPQSWPKQFTQKWKLKVGMGDATPALVGDRLYVFALDGAEESITARNAADGKVIWENKYAPKATVSGAASRHGQGPRSSPAVAEGKVVTLGVSGILSCVDADSGKTVWRKEFFDEFQRPWPMFYTSMSPIIVNGLAIAHVGNQSKGAVVAFDLASGQLKWRWDGDGPAYASPAVMTVDGVKQVVALTDREIVSLNAADGKLLWHEPFAARRMTYNAVTPLIDGQTIYYMGAGRGTRAAKVEKQGDSFVLKELWNNPELAPQFSTPVLKDGKLYGLSDRGNLYCMDAGTGKTLWTDGARRGQYGAIVDAGTVLMALTSNSELIVFQPNDKQFTQVAGIKVADSPTYAYPVLSGNRLYIKDKEDLTLFTIE